MPLLPPRRTSVPVDPDGEGHPAPLAPSALRDWEIPASFGVAALLLVIAILELTITHGKGAPATPSVILPAIGVAAAVGQAMSVRRKNRLITGIIGIVGGIGVGYSKVPDVLAVLRTVGLFVPFGFAFILTQRQSRAQRELQGPRVARQRGGRGKSRGAKTTEEPVETGPKPNRRYTPPKPPEERTRRR